MIAWEAPFVPDDDGERLRSDGSRDCAGLVTENDDGTYEVNF